MAMVVRDAVVTKGMLATLPRGSSVSATGSRTVSGVCVLVITVAGVVAVTITSVATCAAPVIVMGLDHSVSFAGAASRSAHSADSPLDGVTLNLSTQFWHGRE